MHSIGRKRANRVVGPLPVSRGGSTHRRKDKVHKGYLFFSKKMKASMARVKPDKSAAVLMSNVFMVHSLEVKG